MSMISVRSLGLGKPAWLRNGPSAVLPPVQIYDLDRATDERTKAVRQFIKANHVTFSIIYWKLIFHNHAPHTLGSTYILGGNVDHLKKVYDSEVKLFEKWSPSPCEISTGDWRSYLGKREYQRAYLDFFEDQVVEHGYDWKSVVNKFLFEGREPLVNNLVGGLGHPLIHLAYAYELNSQEVATEALVLSTCFYDSMHKYLDDPRYTKPTQNGTTDPRVLLDRMARDGRFEGMVLGKDLCEHFNDPANETILLEYWNDFQVKDPERQLEECLKASVAVLVGTQTAKNPYYDFFLCHILTTWHAVRVLMPLFPAKWHTSLIRQWWLFTLLTYAGQMRPAIDTSLIEDVDLKGRGWDFVVDGGLNSQGSEDCHYVKACRAFTAGAETFDDANNFYLKAAVRFVDGYTKWGYGEGRDFTLP